MCNIFSKSTTPSLTVSGRQRRRQLQPKQAAAAENSDSTRYKDVTIPASVLSRTFIRPVLYCAARLCPFVFSSCIQGVFDSDAPD